MLISLSYFIERTKEYNKMIGTKCPYCDIILTEENVTRDHVVPKKRGGSNNQINLLACCQSCNSEKSDTSLLEFLGLVFDVKSALKKTKTKRGKNSRKRQLKTALLKKLSGLQISIEIEPSKTLYIFRKDNEKEYARFHKFDEAFAFARGIQIGRALSNQKSKD